MKRGFTILELLVASLLLGMLMTILTMIFNQSSIAWRTGEKAVASLDQVRNNMAILQYESDNLYVWNNKAYLLRSPWDESGDLRTPGSSDSRTIDLQTQLSTANLKNINGNTDQKSFQNATLGSGEASHDITTYLINIKCAGPDREFTTWDDIWSDPYDLDF